VLVTGSNANGFLDRIEWGRSFNPGERMRPLPMLIDDTSSLSVLDIRTRTKRLQMERGLAMIVIDYLQLLTSNRRKDNRQQEVAEIRRDLKILAKEFNVPVLALSQLSREVEGAARQCRSCRICGTQGSLSRTLTSCS